MQHPDSIAARLGLALPIGPPRRDREARSFDRLLGVHRLEADVHGQALRRAEALVLAGRQDPDELARPHFLDLDIQVELRAVGPDPVFEPRGPVIEMAGVDFRQQTARTA